MMLLKHWLKYTLALCLHYSGFNGWRLRRSKAHYALMFHRLSDDYDQLSMSLPPEFARAIVRWTTAYGSIIPVNERPHGSLAFSFSFDDGYVDNLLIPALFDRHPVTVFLATAFIDSDRAFWAVDLQNRLMRSTGDVLDLRSFNLPHYSLHDPEQRQEALYELNIIVKSLRPDRIEAVMHAVAQQLPLADHNESKQFLSWPNVIELHRHGVSFGSHTHNHIITSRVNDEEFIHEMQLCQQLFEHHLGYSPITFAYPNGRAEDISPNSEIILKKLHYVAAATTIEGPNYSNDNSLRIKRYNMAKNRLMTPWGSPSVAMFTTVLVNPLNRH